MASKSIGMYKKANEKLELLKNMPNKAKQTTRRVSGLVQESKPGEISAEKSSKSNLVGDAKLQILFISITGPITRYLYQLPWQTCLESPCGSPSPEGMTCEQGCILNTRRHCHVTKTSDENVLREPLYASMLEKNEGRNVRTKRYGG